MSKKYTYSKTINVPDGQVTYTAVEFDSFEEAKRVVEKGVRDNIVPDHPKSGPDDIVGLGKKDEEAH